ncbi:glycerol-3-phosphate dehydrogenase/oxidase [Yimella sp. cx-51]|uniref:glycerol-3-phosphate dehydrogenase/oxidase n=1 Tax=Yimella sp. cx-51 TaxID=2770551 RepID=UPI00165D948B|nr:glycerol-3-phosphate dehydrogenase/oxidase [Yimella sp. cx-51]MBC9955824.1 glycerol-3-phosphate dehydrogenase/oxidase [Yimella sp. cx-51]QTH37624.1 glycerol-3-phosphate dehydrogenase/oxidase [Yimella sp. cx-51]
MTAVASLDAVSRRAAVDGLRREVFDVLVIGGGITGAGVALDAASRGLRTALIERDDLASGTSRWSSKLVHGGLRYLAGGHVRIAAESARERHLLMTVVAPHLARPRLNALPLTPDLTRSTALLTSLGPGAADLLRRRSGTAGELLPRPGRLRADAARELLPAWSPDAVRGAITYWDGQLQDDARLVVNVARTAATHGARIATYVQADEVGEHEVAVHDRLSGERFVARARVVINAAGVWSGGLDDRVQLAPSRGSHLVLPAARLGHLECVVNLPVPGEFGRFVFVLPQPDGLVYVGLTDEPAPGADGHAPAVPPQDEEFLLRIVSRHLAVPLDRADVVGRFAGLRPLVVTGQTTGSSADISREHLLLDRPGAPLTIVGGKLTTYRKMAQDAVDAACRRLADQMSAAPCVTDRLPLVGAAPASLLKRVRAPRHLVRRYGTLAEQVQAMIDEDPTLGEPVVSGSTTLRAELAYGIRHEGALAPADLIERRTRLTMRTAITAPATAAASALLATAGGRFEIDSIPG